MFPWAETKQNIYFFGLFSLVGHWDLFTCLCMLCLRVSHVIVVYRHKSGQTNQMMQVCIPSTFQCRYDVFICCWLDTIGKQCRFCALFRSMDKSCLKLYEKGSGRVFLLINTLQRFWAEPILIFWFRIYVLCSKVFAIPYFKISGRWRRQRRRHQRRTNS